MALDREALDARVDTLDRELSNLARRIHDHPELRFEEHRAVAFIDEVLKTHGVELKKGTGGLDTAFRATAGKGKPKIAVLAEYDALPELGHACGHNLIAAGAVGAFLSLASQLEAAADGAIQGSVELIGTPAEEGGGGKLMLINAGVFDGLDAVLMYHPFDRDVIAHPTLANRWLEMTFEGKSSHAAIAPHEGQSALTACLDTFRLVDSQRVHFRDGVRVHGIVVEGGSAVNIIPERAACEFSIRARDAQELARVRAIVERCGRAAALASDVDVTIERRGGYDAMWTSSPIAERMSIALKELGRDPDMTDDNAGAGSTDMGNVSQVVPSVHAWLGICDRGAALCHDRAFAEHARSAGGMATMLVAAKAMARTVADLLEDEDLRVRAAEELRARQRPTH